MLRALTRHWWQALAIWLVGTTALAAVVYTKFKPDYLSYSLLRVEPQGQTLFDSVEKDSNHIATQVEMIKSPGVLSAALQKKELQNLEILRDVPDAETQLRSLIKVQPIGVTYIIRVEATTGDPSISAKIVNAVVDSFVNAEGLLSTQTLTQQIESLELAERNLRNEIEVLHTGWKELVAQMEAPPEWAEAQLRGLRTATATPGEEKAGTSQGDENSTINLGQYARLHNNLLELDLELIKARTQVEKLRLTLERGDFEEQIDAQVNRAFQEDPDVAKIAEEIRAVDDSIARLESLVNKKSDPAYRQLYSRRQLLTQTYGKLWAAKAPHLRALMSRSAGPQEALRTAQEKVAAITAEKEAIEAKLATIQIESKKTGEKQIELVILRTELNGKQNMLDKVEQRLQQFRFDQQSANPVDVIDKARPIGIPLNNKRNKMLAMAPVGMLGLVMGLFTLLELRAGRVGSPDELSSRVPVEVFSVPPLPVVRQPRGLKDARNNEAQFEAFVQQLDHLRVALCGEAAQQTGRGRCVLITSATGGEGKTTLAAQLAVRCAEAGARTVLIDADLRRPTLGKLFEVPECPGLSDVLREEAPLEDALVPISQVGGCQLLPAGSPEPNPNRVLRGQQFAPMLEHLRRNFDVIIIDTPPVLPVPDALIMGRYADGVVLAARHDRSRFPLVERANTLLTGAGIPVLGVVINGVRPSGMRYGQYAYSYRTDRSAEGGSVGRAG
jgi:capsular exopolysaccharide synthesis family protein